MLGNGGNDHEVVPMSGRERERSRAPLRLVEAYWHGLCAGADIPLRSEVDPRGMESALENAFLLERIAPTLGKIRVAGSHLSDLMGMQIAGMPLSSLIAPDDRDDFGKAVARLFADPAVIRIKLRAEGGFGKPAMNAEMILLPLRSDFGEVSRALGALVSEGRIGRTPRRFRVTGIEVESATTPGIPTIRPDRQPQADLSAAAKTGLLPSVLRRPPAPKPTQGKPVDLRASTRRHLRLVVDND